MASFFEIRMPTDFAFAGEIFRTRTIDFTRMDAADLVKPLLLIVTSLVDAVVAEFFFTRPACQPKTAPVSLSPCGFHFPTLAARLHLDRPPKPNRPRYHNYLPFGSPMSSTNP